MIPVYTSKDMAAYEKHAAHIEGIEPLTLMERAAAWIADEVMLRVPKPNRVAILIGSGNNGGDGLAALCLLHERGIHVCGVIVPDPACFCGMPLTQYQRATKEKCILLPFGFDRANAEIAAADMIVDALFGTGLSREITGPYAEAVKAINQAAATVLSIDIPSGVSADTGRVLGCAVHAETTITFQQPKPGHFLFPGRMLAGDVRVKPISETVAANSACGVSLMEESDVRMLLPARPIDSHKGLNGRALLIAGCETYAGAAVLSSTAALRAGCGILVACVPGAVKQSFSILPQAICIPVNDAANWDHAALASLLPEISKASVIGLGPGAGAELTMEILTAVLNTGKPLVLDADGLNLLSRHRELFPLLHEQVILTPHIGEMARLLNCDIQSIHADPVGTVQACARGWRCCVLLKGATTIISTAARAVLVTQGNPGLAKAGSGDVLTGLILGLLAQGILPFDAACAGAYLLGTTADTALRLLGSRMLMSGDLLDAIQMTLNGFQ